MAEKALKIAEEQEKNRQALEEERRKERIATRRFWLTFSVAAVAALAAVAGVLLQLLR